MRALNQIRGRVLGRIPKWGIVLLGIVLLFPYSFLIFYSNARVVMDKYVGYGNDLWYAEISSSASIHSFKLVEPQEVKYLMGAYTPFEWKMYCNLNETHYRADCNAIGALHFNDRSFCSYLNSPALMFVSSQASPLSRCVEGVAQKIQQGL
ncbi:MAG: hypothetical protein ABIP54_01685 [Candidatus Andersenbacteria bacterium]